MQLTRGIAFILLGLSPFFHHLAGGDSKTCRQDNYMMICFMLVSVCEGIKYFSVVGQEETSKNVFRGERGWRPPNFGPQLISTDLKRGGVSPPKYLVPQRLIPNS